MIAEGWAPDHRHDTGAGDNGEGADAIWSQPAAEQRRPETGSGGCSRRRIKNPLTSPLRSSRSSGCPNRVDVRDGPAAPLPSGPA